ncbi:MAG: penicillin-binding protein 2 [Spirochaetota bacterium]
MNINGGIRSMVEYTPKQKTFLFQKGRIFILVGVVILSFLVYTVYLFSLQVVNGYIYKKRAEDVARRVITIPVQRGEIYDRRYDVPLVLNIDSFAVDIIPGELNEENLSDVIHDLSQLISIPEEEIRKKIPENYRHIFRPIEIKDRVPFETISYLAERINDFPGVTWHSKPIRSYLETDSISHVIGYVGNITLEELQVLYNKGYDVRAVLGKNGVEKEYDMILRGQEGKRFRTVDVKGRRVEEEDDGEEVPPVLGKNIVLTIDRNIQEICEKALGARMGSVLVLKPATGEILAMVSYPWYDPNLFYTEEGQNVYTKLSLDPQFPFLNRTIQSTYAPASVFKTIMSVAVLEEEAFPPDRKIVCEGSIIYGDRVFNCHKKTGHGPLDLRAALAESCDIYFFTIGRDYLGIDRIIDYSKKFGLGESTGIDLPGEVKGLVPGPKWKESVFHTKWLGGDTMNNSIGQGYLTVTPLQLANTIAAIVNDGVIYKPHVLKEIRDPISGKILETTEPKVLLNTSIRKETFKKIKENMRSVITEGTAKVVITTDAVKIAGKTGTGEVGLKDRWNSWFAAYAPYNAPNPEDQIVVVVMVEASNEWEWWAPKAANIIFQAIFAHQTYEEAVETLEAWYMLPTTRFQE